MKAASIVTAGALCLSLTGCFTGIESTPRISDKEVRRNATAADKSTEIAMTLNAPAVTQWSEGRKFLVTDAKLSMLFEKEPALKSGDVLSFAGMNPEVSITGDTITVLTFSKERNAANYGSIDGITGDSIDGSTDGSVDGGTDGNGTDGGIAQPRRKVRARLLRYKVSVPPSGISESFTLPMSVDLDMVAAARRQLKGQKYYILSPLRVDSTLTAAANGRRYVAVTIDDVAPGNADYPLRVDITDDTGSRSSVAMTTGTARSSTRNFDKLFATSDPRLRYPAITDNVWDNIVNSRISKGMTTEECHLALGPPNDIRKWHNGGSFFESWTYDNGRYLIFEDGLLSTIH